LNERARLRCELAKKLEKAGNYDAAQEALGELWQRIGEHPADCRTRSLHAGRSAFACWRAFQAIGSTRQLKDAQERAKDLISESITIFERCRIRRK
jgi:hypothetical protein